MSTIEERRYIEYQNYLAFRRDEMAVDIGTVAVNSLFPFVGTPLETREPLIRRAELHEKVAPPMASVAILQLLSERPAPSFDDTEVTLGYAA